MSSLPSESSKKENDRFCFDDNDGVDWAVFLPPEKVAGDARRRGNTFDFINHSSSSWSTKHNLFVNSWKKKSISFFPEKNMFPPHLLALMISLGVVCVLACTVIMAV